MALPENTASTQVDKQPSETNKHDKREKPPTKVIIRRLPPAMTLQEFIEQVSPIPDYDYIYAVKGDMSLGENAFSRVYINFTNTDDIFMFKEKFDNYVFVDNKGHEYAAVVEFASFQKIPKKRGKPRPDAKLASIESEPLYLEFMESLKQQPTQEEKPEFSYQPSNENKNDISTPLLDYLKKRKIDRMKSREEKREERRKREIERKRLRDEEKRKRLDETSPPKPVTIKQSKTDGEKPPKSDDKEKPDKPEKPEKAHEKSSGYKNKDKKYDDKPAVKPKTKYSPRTEKYDYKSRRDDYREKNRRYDETRKEEMKKESENKQFTTPKKVKKYSERREERKLEAKKAEQMKEEAQDNKEDESKPDKPEVEKKSAKADEEKPKAKTEKKPSKDRDDHEDSKSDDQERSRNKENDPRVQRRIRNKDRPTMQLYQPGMLSKKKSTDDDKDTKEQEKE